MRPLVVPSFYLAGKLAQRDEADIELLGKSRATI
jgi:hypothetical protein